MAHQQVGDLVSFTATASSVQSAAIPQKTQYLRVVAIDQDAHVAIGTNPTATTANYYVVADTPEVISIGKPRSQPVVGITTGSTTIIEFQQGTGSQFTVGDTVNLTVTDQSYYDDSVTSAIVTAVDTSYEPNANSGYCRVITVANDSSTGNPASLESTSLLFLEVIFNIPK